MTSLSTTFQRSEPVTFDVRCSAHLARRPAGEGRCQLFAGHDGPHAVMYGRDGERLVRTWRTADPASPSDSYTVQRPWMFGFPIPAWFEATPELAN
jgi:hypothetical protein